MPETTLTIALDRLSRAVGRIEAASQRPAAPTPGLAESFALLDERHGLLRLRIQDMIERLDTLIAAESTEGAD